MQRRYPISKLMVLKEVAGNPVLLYVLSDLSDSDLKTQFYYYLEKEDFEYLEQIVAEATLRGIKFNVNKKKKKP